MKNGWQTKHLGDLCEIELGKTPARANSAFWDEKRETGNVWLSIADLLNAEDNVVVDSKEYVSDKGAEICKVVPKGTLLVSFKLTLGRLAFAGRDLFTNEAIAALTIFNERELSKEFLFYFLHFFDWVKAAENDVKLKGMTLNKAKLKEMDVHFPKSLPEQQRIVGLLDAAFAGLATAHAHAATNLQNARALFASHLQSVFEKRGKGWELKTLGDLFDITSSKRVFEADWKTEGVPFYRAREIVKLAKQGFVENELFISEDMFNRYAAKYGIPAAGDIMVTGVGTLGICYVVKQDDRFYFKDGNIIWLKKKTETDSRFVEHAFRSEFLRKQIDDSVGATVGTFTIIKAKNTNIPLPSLSEQRRVVEQLDTLREETQRLESIYQRKLAALAELKKALLHQAFAGEL